MTTYTAVHRDRMNRLADTIERTDRFDYAHWYGTRDDDNEPAEGPAVLNLRCDTTGCIGGWAVAQAITDGVCDANDFIIGVEGAQTGVGERLVVELEAARYLGLDGSEADTLFIGHAMAGAGWYTDNTEALQHATALDAAKMLRGVASGEYDLHELRERSFNDMCGCDMCCGVEGGEA